MKKKILFLINTLRDGGAEKILVDIVNHLDPDKYDIEVRLIYTRGVYFDRLNSNIKLSFITGKPGTFWATQVSRLLPRLSSELLHRLFIRDTYDIEVAFLEGYATKIVAGAPKGTRKIAWVHCDMTIDRWTDGVFRTEAGFINAYRKIDTVVCVSEGVKEAYLKRFGVSNAIVRYNPIDDESIRIKSNDDDDVIVDKNKKILISIGRLQEAKNFMRLPRIMKEITKENQNVIMWIVGDGPDRHEMEQYIYENNLGEYVKLLGYQKNPYKYLKHSDLFVSPFDSEGYSTVTVESIVLGIPVITTECTGMREILGDNEYGIIVDNCEEALKDGVQKLLNDDYMLLEYKNRAMKHSKDFEMHQTLKRIEELF